MWTLRLVPFRCHLFDSTIIHRSLWQFFLSTCYEHLKRRRHGKLMTRKNAELLWKSYPDEPIPIFWISVEKFITRQIVEPLKSNTNRYGILSNHLWQNIFQYQKPEEAKWMIFSMQRNRPRKNLLGRTKLNDLKECSLPRLRTNSTIPLIRKYARYPPEKSFRNPNQIPIFRIPRSIGEAIRYVNNDNLSWSYNVKILHISTVQ